MRHLTVIAVLASVAFTHPGAIATGVAVRDVGCPRSDRTFAPSPEAATRTTLVPGDPVAVLVCRYWGEQDTGADQSPAGQRLVLDDAKLRSFVRKLNTLRPIPTRPAPSCPTFGGRSVLLLFRYRNAPDDPVRIVRSGCIPVSNGHIRELMGEGLMLGAHWPDEGVL